MSSSQPDSSPLPSDIEGLQSLISQLNDALIVQRAIHASLAELPLDSDVQSQLNDSKTEFRKIQKRLSDARKAEYEGSASCSPGSHRRMTTLLTLHSPNQAQKVAKPKLPLQTMQQNQNGVSSQDFAGGKARSPHSCQPRCPTFARALTWQHRVTST